MKAIVFEQHGGIEVLQYRDDIPIPEISPNEVLINIKAAALNYNDLWGRTGVPGLEIIFPHINGTDGAGVVQEIGSEVTNIKVGDEVMINGAFSCGSCRECNGGDPISCSQFKVWGFQTGPNDGSQSEFVKVPARNVIPKPDNLSWEGAAAVGSILVTVWRMLVIKAGMQAGDYVLIWGAAGGLGSIALQLCNAFNVIPIAVVSSEKKAAFVSKLGVEYIINRSEERVSRRVQKITDRKGVDIVFEHPGQVTWETSVHCLKWGGTLVTCGATTGFKTTLDIRFLWNKQQHYIGSHFGTTAEMTDALRFVKNGMIKPVIHSVLPFSRIAEGHKIMESGDVMGKVVLLPD